MFGLIPEWAIGVGFIVVMISLARALLGRLGPADRLPGRKASRRELAQMAEDLPRRLAEIEDLQRRVSELEHTHSRLAEVEERLDFAERLLAKQRDVERVAPPKS